MRYKDMGLEQLAACLAKIDYRKNPKKWKRLKRIHNKKFQEQHGVNPV